jgi:hypothetical protein
MKFLTNGCTEGVLSHSRTVIGLDKSVNVGAFNFKRIRVRWVELSIDVKLSFPYNGKLSVLVT